MRLSLSKQLCWTSNRIMGYLFSAPSVRSAHWFCLSSHPTSDLISCKHDTLSKPFTCSLDHEVVPDFQLECWWRRVRARRWTGILQGSNTCEVCQKILSITHKWHTVSLRTWNFTSAPRQFSKTSQTQTWLLAWTSFTGTGFKGKVWFILFK